MKKYVIFAFIAAILIVVFGMIHPEWFYSPGDLHRSHAKLVEGRCVACHPGVSRSLEFGSFTCGGSNCHDDSFWQNSKGGTKLHFTAPGAKPDTDKDCHDCHTEHLGPDAVITRNPYKHESEPGDCLKCHYLGRGHLFLLPEKAGCGSCHIVAGWRPAKFDHDNLLTLPAGNRPRCDACHAIKTGDAAKINHPAITKNADCAVCHDTGRWKPAKKVDHATLDRSADCIPCHKLPQKHDNTGTSPCGACHLPIRWKPADFKHSFPIEHGERRGGTKNTCASCHPAGKSLAEYDCMSGCHEHNPTAMRLEHIEEGVITFGSLDRCVKCHKTGRGEEEHEHEEEDDD